MLNVMAGCPASRFLRRGIFHAEHPCHSRNASLNQNPGLKSETWGTRARTPPVTSRIVGGAEK